MRSLSLFLSILGVTLGNSAAAEPVTRPARTCELTITRAPDAVRAAIEAWVKAEPQCSTSLELRVVPTDGGFYLIGRDGSGRLRERVVPDAQSAGVLVASWMADDVPIGPAPAPAPPTPPAGAPPPAVEPMPVEAPPAEVAPAAPVDGFAAPIRPPGEAAPAPYGAAMPEDGLSRRWMRGPRAFSVGALFGQTGGGVRGELELRARGRWTAGIALSLTKSQLLDAFSDLEVTDARAVATVARSATRGKWTLRGHAGLGVTRTAIENSSVSGAGVFPTAEVGATVSRALKRGWSVVGGPIATWYMQDVVSQSMEVQRGGEVLFFAGVKHQK